MTYDPQSNGERCYLQAIKAIGARVRQGQCVKTKGKCILCGTYPCKALKERG